MLPQVNVVIQREYSFGFYSIPRNEAVIQTVLGHFEEFHGNMQLRPGQWWFSVDVIPDHDDLIQVWHSIQSFQ